MNRVRIIGLIFLFLGSLVFLLTGNDIAGMVAALLAGLGIGLLLTGQLKLKK